VVYEAICSRFDSWLGDHSPFMPSSWRIPGSSIRSSLRQVRLLTKAPRSSARIEPSMSLVTTFLSS